MPGRALSADSAKRFGYAAQVGSPKFGVYNRTIVCLSWSLLLLPWECFSRGGQTLSPPSDYTCREVVVCGRWRDLPLARLACCRRALPERSDHSDAPSAPMAPRAPVFCPTQTPESACAPTLGSRAKGSVIRLCWTRHGLSAQQKQATVAIRCLHVLAFPHSWCAKPDPGRDTKGSRM
jgi:hypothetical protein